MTNQMKVGSLFAGIGGFDIAAERAGMTVAFQSEIDQYASRVLDHHYPSLNLGDIHEIATLPQVDVLCGGFPCQDYSVAGNREGLAGDRGALWWEYLRLIKLARPRWVLGENVPGLISSRGGEDFATIVESLTECGYGVVWGVLDAQYFGVAQRRRRVFIVGHSGGRPRPEVLALGEGLCGHPQPVRETGEEVAGTSGVRIAESRTDLIAFTQNQRAEVRDLDNRAGSLSAKPGVKQQTYIVNSAQDPITSDIAQPIDQNSRSSQSVWGDRIPRIRRLTPLECERLQGFPDGWTDIPKNSNSQRYRQLGNAVAVPVATWIMKRIAQQEEAW